MSTNLALLELVDNINKYVRTTMKSMTVTVARVKLWNSLEAK